MELIWQPKIALISFLLIFSVVYLVYLLGEKKYQKKTSQTTTYFSGGQPPEKNELKNCYWGFFEDFKKLYRFLFRIQKENANDYIFIFIFGLVIFLLILSF
jgi:hypothetical protein